MKPPPLEPPPTVTSSFLSAIAALTWGGNHLVTGGSDVAEYPTVRGLNPGAWALVGSPGLAIAEATYLGLVGATPAAGGGYTTAAGETLYLRIVSGWATPSTM